VDLRARVGDLRRGDEVDRRVLVGRRSHALFSIALELRDFVRRQELPVAVLRGPLERRDRLVIPHALQIGIAPRQLRGIGLRRRRLRRRVLRLQRDDSGNGHRRGQRAEDGNSCLHGCSFTAHSNARPGQSEGVEAYNGRMRLTYTALICAICAALAVHIAAQTKKPAYRAPRTSWGAPDIHGDYTNKDEANTPLERPAELDGKDASAFSEADLAQLAKQRATAAAQFAGGIGGAETGAGPTHWYDHLQAKGSRPWFIVDPPDGQLPPMTPQAQRREAAIALLNDARNGEGRADSPNDRSMYDRCITRGLPGSMMPA